MEHMNLMGSEDVRRGGANMIAAAEQIQRAAMSIDSSLEMFIRRFEDLVIRLEQLGKVDES